MTEQWTRNEALDANTVIQTTVDIPAGDMIRVPRDVVERLLREAGYEPTESTP